MNSKSQTATSLFRNNLIERSGVANAAQAVVVTGQFKLMGNHIAGFHEKNANAPVKP